MKIVINKCYGGFGLSKEAYEYLGLEWDEFGFEFIDDRTNEKLIKCVEELGEKANGKFAKLKIVEIPDDTEFEIEEYDGREWIAEKHRTWG
jgi:hypothetical protein